ncbi:hypothetical protein Syncc8109_2755 [Synechococcus sp. WH 8109]|nr:hypothetical protein [Synechococcus sp. WH 8109]AHF65061.1 hypothetical protein Syncc8109_2755 [Synechococcus sp. WH 8109]
MRRALLFTGASLEIAAAGLPSFAAPKQTARTVARNTDSIENAYFI